MIVWSYGGGVQSAAIAVLVREGALPRPDLAVIADTARERRTTWDYLRDVMRPYLEPAGVVIQVAGHELASRDLYAADGLTLVPAFTRSCDGVGLWGEELYSGGRLANYCSGHRKRDVVERWLRLQGVKDCDCWIGYSLDERRRVPDKSHRPWCRYAFPLIDKGLTRAACLRLIEAAGLPAPRKSRCWGCPHQNAEEWAETLADPVDGPKAVELDREIRESDPTGQAGLFLHYSRVPLDMVRPGGDGILPPPSPCEGGHCWT